MLIRLLLLRALAPGLFRFLVTGFLTFVSLFYLLALVSMFTGCSSATEERLEQIERQNRETQELYREKAREFREQIKNVQAAQEQRDRDRSVSRFDTWLTQVEVAEKTGLTPKEIDGKVLQGKLKTIRRPDLSTLYDPADVDLLVKQNGKEQR